MANVQKYFEEFHDEIKLGRFDENATLREKRDTVITKLKTRLDALFADREEDTPTFTWFNQGSYEMDTGIKPAVSGDYDIDVGIIFDIKHSEHDPVDVKTWVTDALEGHTKKVEMRRPCVTVFYQRENEPVYHVDLAIYSDDTCPGTGCRYLAKGKKNSSADYRVWEESNPQKLCELISGKCSGDDACQFRRVIRYLKRWKDHKFSGNGNGAPTGIALTIAAYHWFAVNKQVTDLFTGAAKYNDLKATRTVAQSMINNFRLVYRDGEYVQRLELKLPLAPWSDLLERITDNQMKTLKERLTALVAGLNSAESDADPKTACETLAKVFGADFPIPPAEETATQTKPAFTHSSTSA